MSWVFEHSESTLGARLVLLAIAGHADRDGCNSWASVGSLAEEARLSERQTQYALRKLEADGEIRRAGRTHKGTHVYELPKMGGRNIRTRGGAISDTEGVQPTAPEPRTKPSKTERERDPAFDALATSTGYKLDELTRSNARMVGVKLAEIHDASGLVGQELADEIRRRAVRYRTKHPSWELTPGGLVNHWAALDGTAARERRPYDHDDPEEFERIMHGDP